MSNSDLHISTRSRARKGPFTPEERRAKQAAFLTAYAAVGIVKAACQQAGIDRKTYYNWRDHDKIFAALLVDATEDAHDTLEYAAYQQAVEGTEEPALSMGQVVYEMEPDLDEQGWLRFDAKGKQIMRQGKQIMLRKYSPQLLITLLKANMPEKYKDKKEIDVNRQITALSEQAKDELLTDLMAAISNEDQAPPQS